MCRAMVAAFFAVTVGLLFADDANAVIIVDEPDIVLTVNDDVTINYNPDDRRNNFMFSGSAFEFLYRLEGDDRLQGGERIVLGEFTTERSLGSEIDGTDGFSDRRILDPFNLGSEGESLYYGIRFRNGRDASFLFGWIEVLIGSTSGPATTSITIETVAFEDSGAGITVGDTGIAPVPLPAAGPFAVIGFACLGIAARRRARERLSRAGSSSPRRFRYCPQQPRLQRRSRTSQG
ncbi:MAG: hypothetical protein AAGG47_14440 [Pseudomonadota bacterium]